LSTLHEKDEQTARKKGLMAGAAVAASGAAVVIGAPVLGVLGLIPAAYLTYDWFMFRAKRGMRF
jgi:L-serine deaminase